MENRSRLTPSPFFSSLSHAALQRVLTALVWLLTTGAMFNCNAAAPDIERTARAPYQTLLAQHTGSGQQTLRVKVDATRNRLWVLALQDVFVYDTQTNQTIKRIALPAWSVAGIQCAPDMVLDSSGSALVSSNVEPRLWIIDAVSFGIKEHAIRLLGKENLETGFGALAFTADGTLFALSSFAGSLWRIEPDQTSASEIKLSTRLTNVCAMQALHEPVGRTQRKNMTLCIASNKDPRRILVSSDFNHARVINAQCAN